MQASPQSRNNSKATPLQRVVLFSSLAALFLVAVAAEEPGEESCCPEDECQIIFTPGSPQLDLNEIKSVQVRVLCDGEERQANWQVTGFDSLLLRSAVINNFVCEGSGVTAPCVVVSAKAAGELSESAISRVRIQQAMSEEAPLIWFACMQIQGVQTDDPVDFIFYQGTDVQVGVKATFNDNEGKSQTITKSLIVRVELGDLVGNGTDSDQPLELALETPP